MHCHANRLGVSESGQVVELTELTFKQVGDVAEAGQIGEDAVAAAPEIEEAAMTAADFARLAGDALGAPGIVASIGTIIFDGVEGGIQKDKLIASVHLSKASCSSVDSDQEHQRTLRQAMGC